MPTWPSPTFMQRFVWSPSTIPYTNHTISPVPHQRPPIWPTDHVAIFSFLSLFSFTQHVLLWPGRSQVITLCDWDLTICFAAHEPCACFTYHLYLRLLYLLQKRRKFFPRTQTWVHFVSSFCLSPSCTFALFCTPDFALLHHHEPLSCTTLHSLILRQKTISLLPNHTPQNHIGHTLRSQSPPIFVAS